MERALVPTGQFPSHTTGLSYVSQVDVQALVLCFQEFISRSEAEEQIIDAFGSGSVAWQLGPEMPYWYVFTKVCTCRNTCPDTHKGETNSRNQVRQHERKM